MPFGEAPTTEELDTARGKPSKVGLALELRGKQARSASAAGGN